jgi:hypothetical protein
MYEAARQGASQARQLEPTHAFPTLDLAEGRPIWIWPLTNPAGWLIQHSAEIDPWTTDESVGAPGTARTAIIEHLSGYIRMFGIDFFADVVTATSNVVSLGPPPGPPGGPVAYDKSSGTIGWSWSETDPPYWGIWLCPTGPSGYWTYTFAASGSAREWYVGGTSQWYYVQAINANATIVDGSVRSNVVQIT